MTLIANTAYNFLASILVRGSSLTVLSVSYFVLSPENYFDLTRFILLIEVFSGITNIQSKQGLMRRKYFFYNEIILLLFVQFLFGILIIFLTSNNNTNIIENLNFDFHMMFSAMILSFIINSTYVFDSIARSKNLYKEISFIQLYINVIAIIFFLITLYLSKSSAPFIFIIVQRFGNFFATFYLTQKYKIISKRSLQKNIIFRYHMKYTFHTFSEGFSSALYRPGIQLVIASFISKEDANLLFWFLRILEGLFYQLSVNMTQVFYTNYRISIKYLKKTLNFVFLYQMLLIVIIISLGEIFKLFNAPFEGSISLIILAFTITPYTNLLTSQNKLMYEQSVGINIFISLVCKSFAIFLIYFASLYYGFEGYIFSYTLSVFIASAIFTKVSNQSLPLVIIINLIILIGVYLSDV